MVVDPSGPMLIVIPAAGATLILELELEYECVPGGGTGVGGDDGASDGRAVACDLCDWREGAREYPLAALLGSEGASMSMCTSAVRGGDIASGLEFWPKLWLPNLYRFGQISVSCVQMTTHGFCCAARRHPF